MRKFLSTDFCLPALLASGTLCFAETGGEVPDEAALRADARKVFKGKVSGFLLSP